MLSCKSSMAPRQFYLRRHGRDWASLPQELLEKIDEKLGTNAGDYVRFRSVCKTWRCVAPRNILCPWLMLPCRDDDTKYGGDFFCPSDNKVYHLPLPENCGKRCVGSSQGWLCFIEPDDLIITLFNPFTKAHIQLPSVTTLPNFHLGVSDQGHREYLWRGSLKFEDRPEIYSLEDLLRFFFMKVILSENPTPNSFTAMIMYCEEYKMAFCKPGDTKWSTVKPAPSMKGYIEDAIYHQGQFYFLRRDRALSICNTADEDPKEISITGRIEDSLPYVAYRKYLVEVSGELIMLIVNFRQAYDHEYTHQAENRRDLCVTKSFYVFKFMPESNEWVIVTSLGDHTLFVGLNSSFSLLAAKYLSQDFKPNCVYFTERYQDGIIEHNIGGYDVGIFNLEDDSVERFSWDAENQSCWIWPPRMWITPTLR